MKDDRYGWVDAAKGIGMVLIVYGHVAHGVDKVGLLGAGRTAYELADSVVYTFHIPLFFFLSGLFFSGSLARRGPRTFGLNKVDTIAYPFVVWSIIQGGVEVVLSRMGVGQLGAADVMMGLLQPRNHLWFLQTLFFIFMLNVAMVALAKRAAPYITLGLAALLYLARDHLPTDVLLVNYMAANMVYFNLGVVCAGLLPKLESVRLRWLVLVSLLFVGAEASFHLAGFVWDQAPPVYSLGLGCLGSLWLVLAARRIPTVAMPAVLTIGKYSMEIYLMHIFASYGFREALHKGLGVGEVSTHLIAGTIVGVILPLIAILVIRKLRLELLFVRPRFLGGKA